MTVTIMNNRGKKLALTVELNSDFHIVVSGQLDVLKAIGTVDERLIARQGSGEMIGEMSLLNPDGLRTASARAHCDVCLLELSRDGFNRLLNRYSLLAYEMVRVISARLKTAHDATIHDMQLKNRELQQAYENLQAAQQELVEKEWLEREEVGHEIQMSLLPKQMSALTGFDFGARLAHALLHAEATRGGTPREVLQSTNRHLLAMNANELFVTVIYGVLDGNNREFTFARAGHEVPLLCDGQGAPILIEQRHAMPLGIWDDIALDEQTVILPPGGMLLLYTDGVTDARNREGAFFGIENLRATLRASSAMRAQQCCDTIMQRMADYSGGGPQDDDITVVVVHASG